MYMYIYMLVFYELSNVLYKYFVSSVPLTFNGQNKPVIFSFPDCPVLPLCVHVCILMVMGGWDTESGSILGRSPASLGVAE